jgi:hypothetical protein
VTIPGGNFNILQQPLTQRVSTGPVAISLHTKSAAQFSASFAYASVVVVLIGVLTLGLAFLIALRCSSRR